MKNNLINIIGSYVKKTVQGLWQWKKQYRNVVTCVRLYHVTMLHSNFEKVKNVVIVMTDTYIHAFVWFHTFGTVPDTKKVDPFDSMLW